MGQHSRVGGEVSSTIIHGYANKQHEGFLGHSYVGEWVNLGAGTITSNLKNTYGSVRVSLNGQNVESGEQFVGAMIGDHAKTGIGTILPTGCILGCNANVFTRAPVPKFVPSFAWLTDDGLTRFEPSKALEIAQIAMSLALVVSSALLVRSFARLSGVSLGFDPDRVLAEVRRVLAPNGRISRIINTLEHISFNFGPTLLLWLEREDPATYAAILAADVVGYSRLVEQDEGGTLSALKARRRDVLEPLLAKYQGRIVKLMGDGALLEFASAVNAVRTHSTAKSVNPRRLIHAP